MTTSETLYRVLNYPNAAKLNPRLCAAFMRLNEAASVRRSHYFKGRYENLYLSLERIPELVCLLEYTEQAVRDILGQTQLPLRTGFWFNYMQPGDTTTLHSHDDDDELLSAVYYLRVPPDSGDLILHPVTGAERVVPQEGRLILFSSTVPHRVSENRSDEARLSIGMNIGPG